MKGDCRRLFNPQAESRDTRGARDARDVVQISGCLPECQDVRFEDIQTESHQNEGRKGAGDFCLFSQRVV